MSAQDLFEKQFEQAFEDGKRRGELSMLARLYLGRSITLDKAVLYSGLSEDDFLKLVQAD